MNSVLYLTRNGLLEPLGQSQVFSYLKGLSSDYQITLITYEKKSDWSDVARVAALRSQCESLGIRWLPQRFVSTPKLLAPAFSMLRMVWIAWREARKHQVKLIHARSYIPAAVALIVGKLCSVPFVFDMRALWPEELITAKRLRRNSLLHRLIVFSEYRCLMSASAVVSLTEAAVSYLRRIYPQELSNKTIFVIPTCADLDRFVPQSPVTDEQIIGCLGTVLSGWFRLDWLKTFMLVSLKRYPNIRFELTTLDDPFLVRSALGEDSQVQSVTSVRSCPSDEVQNVIVRQIASVMFYAGGEISELGRSPTRMAEILGCGLPVVANEGVGDVAQVIRKYKVGVLVSGPSEQEMEVAYDELMDLRLDPELPARCRQAAEELFSLQAGVAAYLELYAKVLSGSRRAEESLV